MPPYVFFFNRFRNSLASFTPLTSMYLVTRLKYTRYFDQLDADTSCCNDMFLVLCTVISYLLLCPCALSCLMLAAKVSHKYKSTKIADMQKIITVFKVRTYHSDYLTFTYNGFLKTFSCRLGFSSMGRR